jgi:ArsR family transcriptional regulator
MELEKAMRALASDKRLLILDWLKTPRELFPPQVSGDLVRHGVCGLSIAQKLEVTQPTASQHLKILSEAGLIQGTRIKQWTFYKRNEQAIKALKKTLVKNL